LRKPTLKWTDAVKMASQQLGGNSVGGRTSKATIYVRSSKTKTGKTRLKVHARAKGVRKKTTAKSLPLSNKYTPQTYQQFLKSGMAEKLPITSAFKPLPKSKAKPKPRPFKEVFAPVKVTQKSTPIKKREAGLYVTDLKKGTPQKRYEGSTNYIIPPTKVKKEKGVYRLPFGGNFEDYPRITTQNFTDKFTDILYTNDHKLALKGLNQGKTIFARPKGKKYQGYYFFLNTPSVIEQLMYQRDLGGRMALVNDHLLWEGYIISKPISSSGKSTTKNVAGLSYVKGKPMLSLSGYTMAPERIFIGSNAVVCRRVRTMNKKPKNIGELTEVYSIPEIKIEVVGTRAVKNTPAIRSSNDGARAIRNYIDAKFIGLRATKEIFGVLCLNNANKVMGVYISSIGARNSVVIDMGYILSVVAKIAPKGIILFHNHPSGNMKPSSNDENVTQDIKRAICKPLEVQLIDHIIVSGVDDEYTSMAEEGLI
jgi:DNA repair protein RadC